jgi:hypothetical protein
VKTLRAIVKPQQARDLEFLGKKR